MRKGWGSHRLERPWKAFPFKVSFIVSEKIKKKQKKQIGKLVYKILKGLYFSKMPRPARHLVVNKSK